MKNKFKLTLILLFAVFLHSSGRPIPFSTWFKVVDTSDGLPDNSVNAIAEDSWGSIWVGTWNGLCRYDGRNISVYKNHPKDSTTLHNNMVRAVLPVREGVFVGNDGGLDFYNFKTGRFCRCDVADADDRFKIEGRVSRLFANGRYIFALTSSGELLRLENRDWRDTPPVFVRISTHPGRRYADICRFNQGRLMLLSNEGIGICNDAGDVEIAMTHLDMVFSHDLNIYCDTLRGDVYVGNGLGRESLRLSVETRNGVLAINRDGFVASDLMAVTNDADGNVVFGTDGHGLQIVKADGSIEYYTPDKSSIPGDVIYSLFRDSKGNLWCGSYRRGLFLLSPELNQCRIYDQKSGMLNHNIVTAVVNVGSRQYIGLDGGGIDILDPLTSVTINRNSHNSGLPGDNVTSIVSDGRKLWISVYSHGLVEYDPETDHFTSHPLNDAIEPGNHIWTLAVADNGRIIVGGRRLSCYDQFTGRFSEIVPGEDINVTSMMNDGHCIWVATRNGGFFAIDSSSAKVVSRFSYGDSGWGNLPNTGVDCIFHDSKGLLWLTMGNSGLYTVDRSGDETVRKCYGSADGLTDTRVKCMAEDSDGNLWVGTVDGLYRYVRLQDRFVKVQNSRLPREYTANSATFYSGRILMGSTSGLVSIPYTLWSSRSKPLPTIISAIDVPGTHGVHIPLYGSDKSEVCMRPDQNFFTMSFTVPDMVHPDQIQIQCRLIGLEDDWRNVNDTRSATYTNVPPGDYIMSVRHSESDGRWSEPVNLKIMVLYPWYLRWWALLIWAVMIAGICITTFRLWRHYTMQKAEAMEAEREKENERKIAEAKLDFFTGISHELRVPCFLISAQIEEIINNRNTTVRVGQLKDIYRNTLKLDKLIGNLMAFRKMETGNLQLNVRNIDVGELLSRLSKDYAHLCRQKGIKFTFIKPEQPAMAMADSDKIEIIVTNLVTNAYKFTPKNGHVELKVGGVNQSVTIEVRDTGIGIMKEHLTTIFDPFYRTERGKAESSGDGIGLSFVKKLVELHKGSIIVESEVNSGTHFTVVLPGVANHEVCKDGVEVDKNADEEGIETDSHPAARVTEAEDDEDGIIPMDSESETVSSIAVNSATNPVDLIEPERQFLQQCRDIIEESLHDDDFEIGMLASKLAMSHSSLYKKIKSLTGLTVVEFIISCKIRKSVTMFKEGNTNVQAVAEACGFHDIKNFREAFKRKMGMPPKQYISSLSRDENDVKYKV